MSKMKQGAMSTLPTPASSTLGKESNTTAMVKSATTTDQVPKPEESTNVAASTAPDQQKADGTRNQGQGDGKPKQKRNSFKGRRRGKPGKIHIRLPPIEAYQKDLSFAAEAPGRVVVRLERLMGSDKIRPVDGKYMETLIQRLEEEERIAWEKKIKLRKKAEKERYRQLAIIGLMEPGPGMEDLYEHPVFRVNRILNRLSSIDNTFSNNPAQKLPPIVPIDPFETDESGAFFKEYPTHRALRKEWEKYKDKHPEQQKSEEEEEEEEENVVSDSKSNVTAAGKSKKFQAAKSSKSVPGKSKVFDSDKASVSAKSKVSAGSKSKAAMSNSSKASAPVASAVSISVTSPPSDMEEEDEYDEELLAEELVPTAPLEESTTELEELETEDEPTELEQLSHQMDEEYAESLAALQDKYGVPKYAEFEDEWKPYRSEMIEKLYNDFETADDLFEAARDLFDTYTRQAMLTQEHMKKDRTKPDPSQVKSGISSKRQVHESGSAVGNKESQPVSSAQAFEESSVEETEEEEEMISDEPELTQSTVNEIKEEETDEDTEEMGSTPVETDAEEFQEEE